MLARVGSPSARNDCVLRAGTPIGIADIPGSNSIADWQLTLNAESEVRPHEEATLDSVVPRAL